MVSGFGMLVSRCGYRRRSSACVVTAEPGTAKQLDLADEQSEILIDPSTLRFDSEDEDWTPWHVNADSADDRGNLPHVNPAQGVARVLPIH